jgi:hypothetical protein
MVARDGSTEKRNKINFAATRNAAISDLKPYGGERRRNGHRQVWLYDMVLMSTAALNQPRADRQLSRCFYFDGRARS